MQNETLVAPEAYTLDSALLGRPGNDEIQLDLFLDYASNVVLYPKFQEYLRTEGHLGRHIRRMRDLYANRLAALQHEAMRYLSGLHDVSPVQAGLNTAGFLRNGMKSRQAEAVAANHGIEALGLDRFTLKRKNVEGLLLGFAAFDEREIRRGIVTLAGALERGASLSKVRSVASLANVATSRETRPPRQSALQRPDRKDTFERRLELVLDESETGAQLSILVRMTGAP